MAPPLTQRAPRCDLKVRVRAAVYTTARSFSAVQGETSGELVSLYCLNRYNSSYVRWRSHGNPDGNARVGHRSQSDYLKIYGQSRPRRVEKHASRPFANRRAIALLRALGSCLFVTD